MSYFYSLVNLSTIGLKRIFPVLERSFNSKQIGVFGIYLEKSKASGRTGVRRINLVEFLVSFFEILVVIRLCLLVECLKVMDAQKMNA